MYFRMTTMGSRLQEVDITRVLMDYKRILWLIDHTLDSLKRTYSLS
jgi:hypothetical protein